MGTDNKRSIADYFETRTRASQDGKGERFVTLLPTRPEWLQDAVHEAHGSDLPNDWVYQECRDACEAIDSGDLSGDDALHGYADGRVDVYTRELFQWAADFCLSDVYASAESDASDFGEASPDMGKQLGVIQYCAIRAIAGRMLEACTEHADDEDDETESEAS